MSETADERTQNKSVESSGTVATAGEDVPPVTAPPLVDRRKKAVGWRTTDVMRAALAVLAIYIVLRLAWTASALILTTFMGILFGVAVSAGVDRLERRKIPRGVGAALIVLVFFAVLSGFFAMMAPTLRAQGSELRRRLPEAFEKVDQWFERRQRGMLGMVLGGVRTAPDTAAVDTSAVADTAAGAAGAGAAAAPGGDAAAETPPSFRDRVEQILSGAGRHLFRFLSSTIAVFGGILLVVFLSAYIAADPGLYRRGVLHLIPAARRERAAEVMSAMATVMRKWLVTQLIAMAVIGAVTTIALLILDVKAAFALGFIAGLLEFVPTVGPILSAIPAVAMGLLDSPQKALIVAVVYIAIQFFENQFLIPVLMKGGLDLPPAVTILAQAVMALVFGFLGLLVAVPFTAATIVAIRMLYVEDVLGEEGDVPADAAPA